VPQDSELFENTVLYNLTLATDVPEDIVKKALWITTFDQVADKLPEGVMTDIRERGVNLSGGQKQRLALTRGLLAARGSSLLLLDEPTSSVDLPTEAIIFDRLFAAFADKAIIASVHRLHLLPRFDHICFMQNGMIVEQGSFHTLIAKRGHFYQLWQQHLAQNSASGEDESVD
jgi:ATP-binding cassette subfamily B protein